MPRMTREHVMFVSMQLGKEFFLPATVDCLSLNNFQLEYSAGPLNVNSSYDLLSLFPPEINYKRIKFKRNREAGMRLFSVIIQLLVYSDVIAYCDVTLCLIIIGLQAKIV